MRRIKWLPVALALAGFAFLSSPPSARADLMLEAVEEGFDFDLVDPGVQSDVAFVDNNPFAIGTQVDVDGDGDTELIRMDFDPTVGVLRLSATPGGSAQVGSFLVSGSVHQSNSPGLDLGGGVQVAQIISSSFIVSNNAGATATQNVFVGDTDFTIPEGLVRATTQAFGQIDGTGSVRVRTWDDDANAQFGGSEVDAEDSGDINHGELTPLFDATFTDDYDATDVDLVTVAAPYSKTIRFDITLDPGSSLIQRSNGLTNFVPEPGSMALMGVGVAGAWGLLRRRKMA